MKKIQLRRLIREALEDKVKECPAPTQNVGLNTANRDRAIQADFIKYGPLNVEELKTSTNKLGEATFSSYLDV